MKKRTRKERQSIFPLRALIAHPDDTFTEAEFSDMVCMRKTIEAKSENSVKFIMGNTEEVLMYNPDAPRNQSSPTMIVRKVLPGATSLTETVDIELYGTVIITAFDVATEDFRSLTQREISEILGNFTISN